ncbi:adaptin N terminal region-domain-containing protein [Piptocephalis cylindrospora]|uniref:Adaptin N terminal region-domain-containing protein n=1 Tax=Piptocephalis cylindrospora TaxID=1907219 RepID=A0A4P9XYH3_9FUNG|nr:adaptin N terminal region-domain-containing protein [Piptocephalis cylindrospora]|eukprot:RKP11488.1 adaptin N terminal region-domain-containing protein [Piptocephalis cylindrospora]
MSDYFARAASLAQTATRLTTRLSTSLADRTRVLASDASSAKYLDAPEQAQKIPELRSALESGSTSQQLDALKRIIAAISRGINMQSVFPSVVKLVASKSLDVCRLVYMYLLKYAEAEPDLALLSINTFQKDLQHPNPFIRAMALRVLSGICVPLITHLVIMGIRQGATDISPYVRKSAAYAIIKTYQFDHSQETVLVGILELLLNDRSPLVLGASVVVLREMRLSYPTRLIHPYFRKLCHALVDTDPAGQVAILELLRSYGRTQFTRPKDTLNRQDPSLQPSKLSNQDLEDFLQDSAPASITSPPPSSSSGLSISPDLLLLLKSTAPLLHSQNAGVVMAAAGLLYYLGSSSHQALISRPLLRLLDGEEESQTMVLRNILLIANESPHLFYPHLSRFYPYPGEMEEVLRLKFSIILSSFNAMGLERAEAHTEEFLEEVRTTLLSSRLPTSIIGSKILVQWSLLHDDPRHMRMGLSALVHLVQLHSRSLSGFPGKDSLTSPILTILLRTFPILRGSNPRGKTHSLLDLLGLPWHPIGELQEKAKDEVIRLTVLEFSHLERIDKEAILLLTLRRVWSSPGDNLRGELLMAALELARYDEDAVLRDRLRFYQQISRIILGVEEGQGEGTKERDLVKDLLFVQGSSKVSNLPRDEDQGFTLGSLSLHLECQQPGYDPLLPWATQASDPSLRDVAQMV